MITQMKMEGYYDWDAPGTKYEASTQAAQLIKEGYITSGLRKE